MKLSTAILMATLTTAGTGWAQSPNVLQNVHDKMNGVQQQQKAASDAALSGTQAKVPAAKPAAGSTSKAAGAQASAKPASPAAPAKTASVKPSTSNSAPAKPATANTPAAHASKAGPAKANSAPVAAAKPASAPAPAKAAVAGKAATTNAPKKDAPKAAAPVVAKADSKSDTQKSDSAAAASAEKDDAKKEERYVTAGNRRDPFVSPIVQHMASTGCSTGKRCLAIDQIALRGVVKSDSGMIAVVVNGLDKAYFLRENDPVFNGYVVKISGDSIVFKETVQDKLGHLSTREVVKKITTPAV